MRILSQALAEGLLYMKRQSGRRNEVCRNAAAPKSLLHEPWRSGLSSRQRKSSTPCSALLTRTRQVTSEAPSQYQNLKCRTPSHLHSGGAAYLDQSHFSQAPRHLLVCLSAKEGGRYLQQSSSSRSLTFVVSVTTISLFPSIIHHYTRSSIGSLWILLTAG